MAVLTGREGVDLADHVGPLLVVDSYRETGLTRYNQKRYFASRPTPMLEATLPDCPHRIFVSVQAEVTHHKYWGHFADVLNPQAVQEFIGLTHERYRQRYGEKFGQSIRSIFVDETQPGWSARLPQRIPGRVRLRPAAALAGPPGCDAPRTRTRGV